MSIKGFIISIENYNGYLPDLEDKSDDAANFRNWLIDVKKVKESDIYACADSSRTWRTTGTTSGEIIKELGRFKTVGANQTEELYFYFSGHGYSSPVSTGLDADVLVASDFDNPDAGRACISLDEIRQKLYKEMGPGEHYYFIDACRNFLNVQYANTGLGTNHSELGTPSVYRLFSTASGQTAKTTSGFSAVLVSGLSGKGIAKEWHGGEMWVVFDRLSKFVKNQIKQQKINHYFEGTGEGKIFNITPIPKVDCRIVIEGALPQDEFQLKVEMPTVPIPIRQEKFTGSEHTINGLLPGDYSISLTHQTSNLVLKEPTGAVFPLPLFDSGELRFIKEALPVASDAVADDFEIVVTPKNQDKRNHNIQPQQETDELFEAIRKYTLNKRILTELKKPAEDSPAGNEYDLGLWLSLLGASQIVLPPKEYELLFNLKLSETKDMQEGESRVLILSGLTDSGGSLEAGLDKLADGWQTAAPLGKVNGVSEMSLPATAGSHLLSLKIPNLPTFTYSIFCLPNRVTLFIVTESKEKQIRVQQFVLPVRHLYGFLPSQVIRHMSHEPLKIIKSIALAQRQFAQKRSLTGENGFSENEWVELINGKWLDPVMSLIGGYELIRRGQNKENNKNFLRTMVKNLRTFFPGIPDTEAIARLIGENSQIPAGPPVLLDGILAFNIEEEDIFGPPANKLDYGSPWTRWFGIVD